MTRGGRQRGTVLVTGLFLVTLLGVYLVGIGRAASVSLALAAGARNHDRAFQAAEDALAGSLSAATFRRQPAAPIVNRPAPGIAVTRTLEYLGETVAIPHPAWDAARDAGLRAHHFRAGADALSGHARRRLARDFAVVAPAGIAASATLSSSDTPANAVFGGAVIPGPWRELPQ